MVRRGWRNASPSRMERMAESRKEAFFNGWSFALSGRKYKRRKMHSKAIRQIRIQDHRTERHRVKQDLRP